MSTTLLENHNRLQILCHRHDKLVNNKGTQNQINKLKLEEELSYYKVRSSILVQSFFKYKNV